jgi:hypothetical protein
VRVCIRLFGTDTWVFDPRWELEVITDDTAGGER